MKYKKSKTKNLADNAITDKTRRKFLKDAGKFTLMTASLSLVSLTQFHCSSTGPDDGLNGYDYHDYFYFYHGGY